MHILSGKFKNRTLHAVRSRATKPTTAALRKSVFDIIRSRFGEEISEATILDVCAGSGAMGLEALSQGASQATFIEIDPEALVTLRKNIELLQVERNCRVIATPCEGAIQRLSTSFDLIYADPPYKDRELQKLILHKIDELKLLKKPGIFFLETGEPLAADFTNKLNYLTYKETRKFGSCFLSLFL